MFYKLFIILILSGYIISIDYDWDDTGAGSDIWSNTAKWTPSTSYPGAGATADNADIETRDTLTLDSSLVTAPNFNLITPIPVVLGGPTLILDSFGVTLGDGSVSDASTLTVSDSASVNSLDVTGTLSIASGKTLTSSGSVSFNSGFTFTNGGILDAAGSSITFSDDYTSTGTLKGAITLASSKLTLNTASSFITGSVSIPSGSELDFSNGDIDGVSFGTGISGTLSISKSVTSPSVNLILSTGSSLSIDASSNSVILEFSSFDFTPSVSFSCTTNPITFTGPLTASNFGVTGSAGCIVTAEFDDITAPLTVSGASLSLTQPPDSNTAIQALTTVDSGSLITNGQLLIVENTLDITATGQLVESAGEATNIQLQQIAGSSINFASSDTIINIDYIPAASPGGSFTLNNAATTMTFGGSGTMENGGDWDFTACTKVNFNQDFTIAGSTSVNIDCPAEFGSLLFVSGNLDISAVTVDFIAGSNLTQDTSGIIQTLASTITISEYASINSINLDQSTFSILSGSVIFTGAPTTSMTNINLSGGSLDISAIGTLTLGSGSVFTWSAGDLITSSNTISASASDIIMSASGKAYSGDITLTNAASLTVSAPVSFSSGTLTASGSTLTIDATVTFPASFSADFSGSSTISHTFGTFQIVSDITLDASTFTSAYPIDIIGSVTATSVSIATLTGTVTVSGDLIISGGSTWDITTLVLSGNLNISTTTTVLTVGAATFSSAVVYGDSVSNSAFSNPIFSGPNAFYALSQGSLSFIDGSIYGTFEASGDGVIAVTNGNLGSGGNSAVITLGDDGFLRLNNIVQTENAVITSIANVGTPATINLLSTADFTITTGTIQLSDTLYITGTGSLTIDGGTLSIQPGGIVTLNGASAAFIDVTGGLSVGDGAQISVTNGVFSVVNPLVFNNTCIIELGGSTLSYESFYVVDNSELRFSSGTSELNGINSFSNGNLIVDGSTTTLTISNSTTVIYSTFDVTNGATLIADYDTQWIYSDATFSGDSRFTLQSGNLTLSSGSRLAFYDSDLDVTEGSVEVPSGGTLRFSDDASVLYTSGGGRIIMRDGSFIEISDSTINHDQLPFVKEGTVNIIGISGVPSGACGDITNNYCENVTSSDAPREYLDCVVSIKNQGCLHVLSNSLTTDQVQFYVLNNGELILDDAYMDMSGTDGFLDLGTNGRIVLLNNTLARISAPATLNPTSISTHLLVEDSSLNIYNEFTLTGNARASLIDSGYLYVSSFISIIGNAELHMVDSEFELFDDGFLRALIEFLNALFSIYGFPPIEIPPTQVNIEGTWTALNSKLFIGNLLYMSSDGRMELSASNVTSNANCEVYLSNTANLISQSGSRVIIGDLLELRDFSNVTITDAGSFIALNTSASVDMYDDSTLSIYNNGVFSINGPLILNQNSSIFLTTAGDFVLLANSDVTMNDDSLIDIKDVTSFFYMSDGLLTMNTDSKITAASNGQFVLVSGQVILNTNSEIQLETFSRFSVFEDGALDVNDFSKITVDSSFVTFNGSAIFYDDSTINIADGGVFTIYGNTTSYDRSVITLQRDGTMDIASDNTAFGVVELNNITSINNDNGNLYVSGSLILKSNSKVIGNDGFFSIDSGELLCSDNSILQLKVSSSFEINGGELNARNFSDVIIDDSTVSILNEDMNIFGSSNLQVSTSGKIFVSGGDAYFYEQSTSFLTGASSVEVETGTAYCLNTASISIEASSKFNVSSVTGFAIFDNNCTITILTDGLFSSNGNTFFAENSSISLTNGDFEVVGGDSTFNESSIASFTSLSSFTISDGNAFFLDNTIIDISSFSVFSVTQGSATQEDNTILNLSTGSNMIVQGNFTQYDLSLVNLQSNTDLTVGGRFHSQNNSRVEALTADLSLTAGASVILSNNAIWYLNTSDIELIGGSGLMEINDFGELFVYDGAINFDGDVNLNNNGSLRTIETSTTIENGNFIASDYTIMTVYNISTLTISDGNILFRDNSILSFDGTSRFIVNDGIVTFQNSSNFQTEIGTIIDISGGDLIIESALCLLFEQVDIDISGDLIMRLNACIDYKDSSIFISSGSLISNNNFDLSFSNTPIDIQIGNANFNGSIISDLEFINLPFNIIEGDVEFSGFTSPLFQFVNLTIINGGSSFLENTNSTWENSSITVFDIEANPFITFSNFAITYFINSYVEIYGGAMSFYDDTQSHWESSNITLTGANLQFIGRGTHNLFNSLVTIDGNADALFGLTITANFDNTDFLVDGFGTLVHFYNNVTISYKDLVFEILGGTVKLSNSVIISYLNSDFSIANGAFNAENYANLTLINTPLTILASASGSMIVSDFAYLKFTNSPITMNSGDIDFSGNSTLEFTDIQTTLDISFGDFVFQDYSNFYTVQGTIINIFSGSFSVLGFVGIDFDQVTTNIGGTVLLTDNSRLYTFNSNFNITGTFTIEQLANFTSESTLVEIYNGTLETFNSLSFTVLSSEYNIYGDIIFRGSVLSTHYTQSSNFTIFDGGDFLLYEFVIGDLIDSCLIVLGGFVEIYDFAELRLSGGKMSLQGVGTLTMYNDTNLVLSNSALVEIITSGATASFNDNAQVNVFSDSTINITDGSVTFSQNTMFNLWEGTNFNLLSGSLLLEDTSQFIAYPFTEGTIIGGNLHITDDALVIFIQSNIHIVGSIDNNSTNPVQFVNGSTITVDGANFGVGGVGIIYLTNGTFLHVLNGSIILRDYAQILSDNGDILVSGGSILAYDYSRIWADNSTNIVVNGGNITFTDETNLLISGQSTVLVTVSSSTQGSIYLQGYSTTVITESSILEVNQGNLEISNHSFVINTDFSTIRVIGGDIFFLDYTTFNAEPTSLVEILEDGNFIAEGVTTSLNFCGATTRIVKGDFITKLRTRLFSCNSTFEISDSGNVIFTDMTTTIMQESTYLDIFGGGNLELFRSAYFTLTIDSKATIGNGGSALFGEDVIFDLTINSSLQVDGGDIIFYGDSSFNGNRNSIGEVTSGGSIIFYDNSKAILDVDSRLSVFDFGGISFNDKTFASLSDNSFLFVQDGGNIEFLNSAILSCDHSYLTVLGGGSIILSGDGLNSVYNQSEFIVDGGNIEYHNTKIIEFDSSLFSIKSGDLLTFDSTKFSMVQQSIGTITGGNLILRDSSFVKILDKSDISISLGNVELYDNGNIDMIDSSISVEGLNNIGGFFKLYNFVTLDMFLSSITISGGNFESNDSVYTKSLSSIISISSGSAIFKSSSIYIGDESELNVSGGNLSLEDLTMWTLTKSSASVSGGNLNLNHASETNLLQSSFDVSGGNINIDINANLYLDQSSLSVTGGDLIHNDESIFGTSDSIITITGGRILYNNESICDITSTSITVNKFQDILTKDILEDDLIIYSGNSFVHIYDNSILDLLLGNFVLIDSSIGLFEDTIITISGGNFRFNDFSTSSFSNVDIILEEGTFIVSDSSSLLLQDQSSISVFSGSLTISNNVLFTSQDSSISITGGSVLFSGGDNEFISSSLSVTGDGSMILSGSSNNIFTNSIISLNGNGELNIQDLSSVSFTLSSVSINSGTFITNGNSIITFLESDFTINGGDTYFIDNSQIYISNSIMEIISGNLYFEDFANIIIDSNSIYSILGGNIFTNDNSDLSISDSCIVIDQGTVSYSGSSSIELISSCWNITGGNTIFDEFVSYTLRDNSFLLIQDGSFLTSDSVDILLDSSKTYIIGGDLNINDQTSLILQNSATIEVEQGNAIFTGDIITSITDSFFIISGGYVEFDGNANLEWINSQLNVTKGDMIIKGKSLVSFSNSFISVSGGGLQFLEQSDISLSNSEILITLGSLNFHGESIVNILDSSIRIESGDIQFGGESIVTFTNSPIYIAGQFEFVDRTSCIFTNSDIFINGGSFHSKDHTDVQFIESNIDISGYFHIQNDADVIINDCWITIDNGDFRILDRGSFSMHSTSMTIKQGDFIVNNPSIERKYVSISDSIITVEKSQSNSNINGNVELSDNVEMTIITTDFIIDGSLILEGNSKLNIYEESSFIIPSGIVQMDVTANIEIEGNSVLLNQGQLLAPGKITAPSDSSLSNEGLLESTHDLDINCNLDDITPLLNSGSLSLSTEENNILQSCINDLRHSGLMQFSFSNVTFQEIETTSDSVFTLSSSSVNIQNNENIFDSNGSVGGIGNFIGSFSNTNSGIIMANGEIGTSHINIENDFSSSGSVYFMINSRDLDDPNAISQITAGGVSLSGGNACVCFNPLLDLEEGDRFDLMLADTSLNGRFDTVEFDCIECPKRSAKSIEGTKSECEPNAEYGAANFAVLLESCDGGSGNYIDSISPPWYVIFPVAIGIIILVIIIFGGALLIEQQYRKRTSSKNIKRKRNERKAKFKDSLRGASGSTTSATSTL